MKPISIIVVVVTHNRPDELKSVIASLNAQTYKPHSILVFDNASYLPAKELLPKQHYLEIIRSETNVGGAGGFASALQVALGYGCDWVWMMDDDAIPRPNALEALVKAVDQLPPTAGVLCSSVYEFNSLATTHRRMFDRRFGLEYPTPLKAYDSVYHEIDTGSFVGFMVRSEAVLAAGLPNKDFFLAYDDTEYSLRLKDNGWSLWLIPESEIDHLRNVGSRLRHTVFGAKHFYNIRNRLFVTSRYSQFGVLTAVIIGILIFIRSKSSLNLKSLRLFCRAVIDGCRNRLGPI